MGEVVVRDKFQSKRRIYNGRLTDLQNLSDSVLGTRWWYAELVVWISALECAHGHPRD